MGPKYTYIYICIYTELQIKYWDQRSDVKVFLQYMFMGLARMGRRISGHRRARWYSRLLDLCKAGARNEATNYLLIYFYNHLQQLAHYWLWVRHQAAPLFEKFIDDIPQQLLTNP